MNSRTLTLTITEDMWHSLDEWAHSNELTMEEMLIHFYRTHMQQPSDYFQRILTSEQERTALEHFQQRFTLYMTEMSNLIADGFYETDIAMRKVFERIRDEHFLHTRILADLYRVYQQHS